MFQDHTPGPVNIPSTWKTEELEKEDAGTQTSVILTDNRAAQTGERQHISVQTEDVETQQLNVNDQEIEDEQKVVEFLHRVYPLMCAEMNDVTSTRAFSDYDVNWTEEYGDLVCMHTLEEPRLSCEVGVAGVSWNSRGSAVAVAYGRLDHQHLCSHKGGVCTWNIDRQSMDPRQADLILDCMSCVICVAFHPVLPSIICAGTFNGEVLVWDIARENTKQIHSSRAEDCHEDAVASVVWTPDAGSKGKKYQIQSVGSDGKVFTWVLPSPPSNLDQSAGLILRTDRVARSLRGGSTSPEAQYGASSVSFSSRDRRQFIVGCESGNIFKCGLGVMNQSSTQRGMRSPDSATGKAAKSGDQQLKSPIAFAFVPLKGPVYGVDCSPFHRNAFLACGTDGCVHFFSALQNRPLFSLDPSQGYLFSVRWSPSRPMVCAVGTAGGSVLLYDLQIDQTNPVLTLEADEKKKAVVSVEFSQKRSHYLACGGVGGQVKIFRLPSDLCHRQPSEEARLQDIVEA